VDQFQALQIKGLWSLFSTQPAGTFTLQAISNGVQSREVIFNINN
jgi:hypothetical protein